MVSVPVAENEALLAIRHHPVGHAHTGLTRNLAHDSLRNVDPVMKAATAKRTRGQRPPKCRGGEECRFKIPPQNRLGCFLLAEITAGKKS